MLVSSGLRRTPPGIKMLIGPLSHQDIPGFESGGFREFPVEYVEECTVLVNTNPSCWPSNPVSFGKILFWISLIIQWAWSMFPSEGWRSDNEGSKLRSHPKLLHKPCMNPESTIIFLGVASAVFQPMFMSNDENTFNNGGGVFMGKGWEWEWGFLQIINIRGQAWMLYGAYMSKLAEWVWNLCLSNPHLSWPLGKWCQYARKTT